MSQNWVSNLDMCANYGIIDYDAAAYLRNQPPRYMGSPQFRVNYPTDNFYGKGPAQQPQVNNPRNGKLNRDPNRNPVWKRVLFWAVGLGALIFAGYKLRGTAFMKWIGKGLTNVWNWIKKPFAKPPAAPTP